MNCRRVARCALLGTLLVTAAPAVHAQEVGPAAQARFDEGVKAYDRGDFEAARQAFLETRKLTTRVSVLRNLAQSEMKTGHPLDALNHFRDYVADPSIARDKRDRAVKAMAEAYHQTGHLVISAEPTARVLVDGAAVTAVDGAVDVTAGPHEVEARAGERHATRTVDAAAGVVTKVDLPLPAVATDGVPATVAGGNPVPPAKSEPGPANDAVSTGAGGSSGGAARWVTAGTLGAVGVVGLVLGGVFASKASSAISDLGTLGPGISCPGDSRCGRAADDLTSHDHDRNAEVSFLVSGGVLVAASIVVAIVWPQSSPVATAGRASSAPVRSSALTPLSFTF
jgi:hypothetical protein